MNRGRHHTNSQFPRDVYIFQLGMEKIRSAHIMVLILRLKNIHFPGPPVHVIKNHNAIRAKRNNDIQTLYIYFVRLPLLWFCTRLTAVTHRTRNRDTVNKLLFHFFSEHLILRYYPLSRIIHVSLANKQWVNVCNKYCRPIARIKTYTGTRPLFIAAYAVTVDSLRLLAQK